MKGLCVQFPLVTLFRCHSSELGGFCYFLWMLWGEWGKHPLKMLIAN